MKMDHIFIVSLLFVACTSFTGAIIPKYSIAYFMQKLDHFNFVQDSTFSQRYLYTGTVSLGLNIPSMNESQTHSMIPLLTYIIVMNGKVHQNTIIVCIEKVGKT